MIDWQKVTINLRRVKPLSAIAKETGLNEQHLNRLARGEVSEPRFNSGLRLLDVHLDYCPDRHRDIFI